MAYGVPGLSCGNRARRGRRRYGVVMASPPVNSPVRGKLRAYAGADINVLRALRRARDRIDRDYAGTLDIATLAAEAGYSVGQFIRAFESAYGETPGRYRTRRRVERACELLRSVNLTVTEVCMLVGFSSVGTFSRRFSELVGRSPSAYRQEAARLGGPAAIPGCFALMWRTGLPAAD
jgi:AraC-like DNA-binding protein